MTLDEETELLATYALCRNLIRTAAGEVFACLKRGTRALQRLSETTEKLLRLYGEQPPTDETS